MSFASRHQPPEFNGPTDGSYPIATEVEYRLMQQEHVLGIGAGRTKTISSSCVVFESERALPVGLLVELAVTWPVRLENSVTLKLQILGRTVSITGNCTIVDILRHEFRTAATQDSGESRGGESGSALKSSRTACGS